MHANAALSLSLARSRSLSRSCVAVRNPPPDAQRTGPFTYFRNLDQRLRAPFGHLSSIVLVGFGLGLVWWVQVFLQREADQHRRWSSVPWKWWIQPAIVGALLAIFPIVTLLRPLVEGDATEEKEKDNPSTQPKELTPEEREKREFQSAQAQEAEYRGLQAARWKEINGKQSDEVERRRSSRVETGARPVPIQNGVGFSGGGIRAAAYATGAAKALLQTGVWPHIQYMSSVSGGGYITSAIALDHKSFRDEKTTGDFLYKRALNAGYCFRQDGTIGQLISSFVHFSSRIVCGMVINNLVLFVNLIWLTRLIDATIGPVLASQAMQRLDPCEALLCMDRLRESTATPFPFLWYFWTTLTILCVVMHILSTKMMGNDAITDLTVPAPKFRGFFARWFGPTFALTRFLWLCLTTLYCVLSIAVMHRGASVELYIRLESGIVAIIALVAIMTVIFSNLSHTSGYDAVSMFVLPLAGVMLVLVSVFVAGLIVAARVHAHLLPGQNHPAPSEILSQNVHAAITNATSTAANSFAEGHLEVCWETFRSFLTTLWNSYSVTWSPSTWAHIDLCGSGAALLLTIVYERLYDTQAKVYRDGLSQSFHIPPDQPPRKFSSLLNPDQNDKNATPIWLCNAVLNDVSYASGLMGRMAFSYCPFLFSPFGMGSISTGFGLFRRKISHPRLEPSWTEPTINYGMSVSAAAFTPAMGPMQKLIPGARLIFNLAGANMGDLLAIRPQTLFNTMTIWVLRLLAAIIFIADFLPFQGDHPVVRNWLPAYILKQSDWMRGFVWILASLAMLCVPLCKIACLPTSENILNAKYIRMLFQSFGYVTEIVPDTTTSAPVPHASSSPALVAPSTTAAALSQEEDDVVHLSPQPIASPAPRRSTRSRSTSVAPETPKAVVKVKTKKISKAAVPAPVLTTPPIVPAPGQSTPSSGISLKSVDFIPNGVKDGSVFPRVNAPAIEITDGGHFENLAVFQLLVRKVPRIFSFDAGDNELSAGRTWKRYDDLATLFSPELREWLLEHGGIRIELTSIMGYSCWDRNLGPEPLFHSTDFVEALHIVESPMLNHPLNGVGMGERNAATEEILRRQARCLVIRFKYLPLDPTADGSTGEDGIIFYSKLQLLGLDAYIQDLPDGPSIMAPLTWPLESTANQFISQMIYLKWALLAEQAAREAAILWKADRSGKLLDHMRSSSEARLSLDDIPTVTWPMRCEYPNIEERPAEHEEYYERAKRVQQWLKRLNQHVPSPKVVLGAPIVAAIFLAVVVLGWFDQAYWIYLLVGWLVVAFAVTLLNHANAVQSVAFEHMQAIASRFVTGRLTPNLAQGEATATPKPYTPVSWQPVPYWVVYGLICAGSLLSIRLPPLAQLWQPSPLLPITSQMSTSYYLPCDIEPSTLGCSVIDMERRGASKAAHDTFEIGEQMGRHLWNLATNRTVPSDAMWWSDVIADRLSEAPLVCLHLLRVHPGISSNISASVGMDTTVPGFNDFCASGSAVLDARAKELMSQGVHQTMLIHGYNFRMVQEQFDFGRKLTAPLIFICLLAYLFYMGAYNGEKDYERRKAARVERRSASPDPHSHSSSSSSTPRSEASRVLASLGSSPSAKKRAAAARKQRDDEECPDLPGRMYMKREEQNADELDESNARFVHIGTLFLLCCILPLEQMLHQLQCYWNRDVFIQQRFSGDASGMLLLFHASTTSSEFGICLLQAVSLVMTIRRPKFRKDRTAEGPLGHLARLLAGVLTAITTFCTFTFWIVRIHFEKSAAALRGEEIEFWKFWEMRSPPWSVVGSTASGSTLDALTDHPPDELLQLIRIVGFLLLILTSYFRLRAWALEHDMRRTIRRGLLGPDVEERERNSNLIRNFNRANPCIPGSADPTEPLTFYDIVEMPRDYAEEE